MNVNVNWTNEQIYQLIDMFQEREFLWNPMLNEYRDRTKKHEAWCEIGNALDLDKHTVEKKMKSLIGQFQRELRKTKGVGAPDEGIKWFAYKRLMFLKDRGKSGRTADAAFERDEMLIFELTDESELEEPPQFPQRQPILVVPPSSTQTTTTPQPRSLNNTLKRKSICKPPVEENRKYREAAFTQVPTAPAFDDSKAYGNYLASKLRQYSRQTRNALQHEISQLLYQADNGHFQSPSYGHSSHRSDPLSTRSPSMEEVADVSPREYETGNASHLPFVLSSSGNIKNENFVDSD